MTIERKDLSPRQTITLGNDKYTISSICGNGTSSIVYDAKTHIEALNKEKKVLIKELFPVNLNIRRDSVGALIIPKASVDLFKKYKESFINAAKLQLDFHNPSEDADTASSTNSTSNLENLYECGNTLYSVMSLDDGQTYEEYNSDDLRSHIEICRNLALAIGRYHERGYLHLDIKPENIFVLADSNAVKLFDFDTVQRKEDIAHQNCQLSYTQAYAPPELLLAETDSDYYKKIDERTDIYMIGATLLYKLFGRTPNPIDTFPFQTWDFHNLEITKTASPQLKNKLTDVLRKSLAQMQDNRYNNISEMICALDHILDLLKYDYYLRNYNVYKTSGNYYIPRTQEIESIKNTLTEYHMVYVYGMGGIGKSETARAYVEEYRNDYSVIQLVGYQTDLAKTIEALSFSDDEGFKGNVQSENDRYQIVYNRLSDKLLNNERTLIIIDNYNYISDVAKDISEKDQKVLETNRKVLQDLNKLSIHFIFTTRNTPLQHDIRKGIEIKEFSSDELRDLFFQINPRYKDDPERVKKVDKILELTGYHTLTVDLIAHQSASIEGMGNHTLDDLIDVISRSGINNEVDVIVPNNKDEKDTYDIVYNHIKALFNFTQLSDIEKYVLATAALLPVTGMKEKDFCELIALDKVSNQPTGWGLNKAITKLVESGWLHRSSSEIVITNMHPIIADIVSNELNFFYSIDKLHHLYNGLKPNNNDWLPYGVEGAFMIINIIKKFPINHCNYIALSNLIGSMTLPPNDYELYWEKVENYIMSNKNIDTLDKAWYYAELVERYLIYPLEISFGSASTWYQKQKAYEHFQSNIEKAKEAASLSIKYLDALPDNILKAWIVVNIIESFSHPCYKEYDTVIHYGKIALKYCKSNVYDKTDRWDILSRLEVCVDRGHVYRNKAAEIEFQLYILNRSLKNSEKIDKSKIAELEKELEINQKDADYAWDGILTESQRIEMKELLSDLHDYENYLTELDAIELSKESPN